MIDASEITFGLGSDAGRMAAAILFLQSSMEAMDVYSALNSSPWTAQSFGADPEKRRACLEYVHHGVAITTFYCVGAAVLAQNWWPIVGGGITTAYMYWLYRRALGRAQESGSTSWGDSGVAGAKQQNNGGNGGGSGRSPAADRWAGAP